MSHGGASFLGPFGAPNFKMDANRIQMPSCFTQLQNKKRTRKKTMYIKHKNAFKKRKRVVRHHYFNHKSFSRAEGAFLGTTLTVHNSRGMCIIFYYISWYAHIISIWYKVRCTNMILYCMQCYVISHNICCFLNSSLLWYLPHPSTMKHRGAFSHGHDPRISCWDIHHLIPSRWNLSLTTYDTIPNKSHQS